MTYTMSAKRIEAMNLTDGLSPQHRELVHEFGLPIVSVFLKYGIRNAYAIREVIREVWLGARQDGQRNGAMGALDNLLIQSGSGLTAKGLRRFLYDNGFVLVPVDPTRAMLDASMAEVSGHTVKCTRSEKHRRRLRAALRASINDGAAAI